MAHPMQPVWDRCRRLDLWMNEGIRPKAQPRHEEESE